MFYKVSFDFVSMAEKFALFITIVLLLTYDVLLDDGTPSWMREIILKAEKADHFSKQAAKADHFSKQVEIFKCTIEFITCDSLFRATIVHYEDNVIKADNAALMKNFPNLDKEFLTWHSEFKKGYGQYAAGVLERMGKWFDVDSNDIIVLPEIRKTDTKSLSDWNNRRLVWWISFLDGIRNIVYITFNPKTGSYEYVPPKHIILKVWWHIMRKFDESGHHQLELARLIYHQTESANYQAHHYDFLRVNETELPKRLKEFKRCVTLLIRHYNIDVTKPMTTQTYSALDHLFVPSTTSIWDLISLSSRTSIQTTRVPIGLPVKPGLKKKPSFTQKQ